jgi:hypothetical protein
LQEPDLSGDSKLSFHAEFMLFQLQQSGMLADAPMASPSALRSCFAARMHRGEHAVQFVVK